uniref:NF-YB6 n=1 Tax=Helianthus tuberosus TaxID=4233 RepID=A0AB38ZMJ8_HELTU
MDEHDKMLPIANVGRIMKQILPPTAKISKQAKETMQECASEFIAFVTGEATEKCRRDNRKTVNGDDLCWALASLGFDDCSKAVTRYLNKFREFQKDRAAANQMNEEHVNEAAAGPSNSCKEISFLVTRP